jgi:RHS repeat-associated protein
MPGRQFNANAYKYGFNGKENDNEIKGAGNSYTTDYREYDSRLGKWWSNDPIVKPWESPYASFSNNPILYADPKGLDAEDRAKRYAKKHGGTVASSTQTKGKYFVDGLANDDGSAGTTTKVFKNNLLDKVGNWFSGKSAGYEGSGTGHGPRQLFATVAGVNNKAASLEDMLQRSALQFNEVNLTGQLLDKIQNDPNTKNFQQSVITEAESNPKFGKEDFNLKITGGLELGGTRGSFNPFDASSINTLKVARSELTWTVRHADIVANVQVKADRTMSIIFVLTDQFNIRPEGHTDAYKKVVNILGPLYHDVLGGNDKMKVKASWNIIK